MFSVSAIRSTVHPHSWRGPGTLPNTATKAALFEPRYTPKELFCLLGILNSTPFDYLLRSKNRDTPVRLPDYRIPSAKATHRATSSRTFGNLRRLNCYGERFQPLRDELDIDVIEEVEATGRDTGKY